jgi:hypothetical protein
MRQKSRHEPITQETWHLSNGDFSKSVHSHLKRKQSNGNRRCPKLLCENRCGFQVERVHQVPTRLKKKTAIQTHPANMPDCKDRKKILQNSRKMEDACNSNTQEAEVGESQVWSQLRFHSETLSLKTKKNFQKKKISFLKWEKKKKGHAFLTQQCWKQSLNRFNTLMKIIST